MEEIKQAMDMINEAEKIMRDAHAILRQNDVMLCRPWDGHKAASNCQVYLGIQEMAKAAGKELFREDFENDPQYTLGFVQDDVYYFELMDEEKEKA